MAPTIPTTEPTRFVAGSTVAWTKFLDDYPADEYVLSYAFVKDGTLLAVECTADGTDHYAELTIAESAVSAGTYRWQSYATSMDDTERYEVGAGTVEVLEDFATQTGGYDPRSPAEVQLDAINATLAGRATADQLSLSIAGRAIQRTPLPELLEWKSKLEATVKRERNAEKAASGLPLGNKMRVRF